MCKKVDIIIINWNSGQLTIQAVSPYLNYKSSKVCCNVIVVDNASTDNSKTEFNNAGIAHVIYNSENKGFGKACNQAFYESNADYILLLNPDTLSDVIVLEGLVDFLDKDPRYGVTGPSMVDKNRNVVRTCGRFPNVKTAMYEVLGLSKILPNIFIPAPIMLEWNHSESRDVDHVIGSYMLIRKSILDQVGFMDEDYFIYLEDLDLNKRISDFGFKIFYNNNFSIFHEGGGTGEKWGTKRLFYSLYSRKIYWCKHLDKFHTRVLILLSLLVEPFLRIIDLLIKEKRLRVGKIGKAYLMYIRKIAR